LRYFVHNLSLFILLSGVLVLLLLLDLLVLFFDNLFNFLVGLFLHLFLLLFSNFIDLLLFFFKLFHCFLVTFLLCLINLFFELLFLLLGFFLDSPLLLLFLLPDILFFLLLLPLSFGPFLRVLIECSSWLPLTLDLILIFFFKIFNPAGKLNPASRIVGNQVSDVNRPVGRHLVLNPNLVIQFVVFYKTMSLFYLFVKGIRLQVNIYFRTLNLIQPHDQLGVEAASWRYLYFAMLSLRKPGPIYLSHLCVVLTLSRVMCSKDFVSLWTVGHWTRKDFIEVHFKISGTEFIRCRAFISIQCGWAIAALRVSEIFIHAAYPSCFVAVDAAGAVRDIVSTDEVEAKYSYKDFHL